MEPFVKLCFNHFVRFLACGRLSADRGFLHMERVADHYCLIVVIRGELHISQEGVAHDLGPGEMLLLRPGTRHRGERPSPGVHYYWCHFTLAEGGEPQLLDDREAAEHYYLIKRGMAADAERTILLPTRFLLRQPDRASILYHQMMDYDEGGCYSRVICDCAVTSLLIELTQQAVDSYYQSFHPKGSVRYSEVLEWIRIHAEEPLSVGEVAGEFGYNPNYLSGLVKSRTGYSLLGYIHKTKVDLAKDLLLKTNLTIREIADRLGFSDDKYFMRVFKKAEGVTPTRFKNAYYLLHTNSR